MGRDEIRRGKPFLLVQDRVFVAPCQEASKLGGRQRLPREICATPRAARMIGPEPKLAGLAEPVEPGGSIGAGVPEYSLAEVSDLLAF